MAILETTDLNASEREAKMNALLDEFRLNHVRKSEGKALSGGERQRVYLAMALAQGGTTILLDEPGAFLDVCARFELLDLLRSVAAGGKAVVLVMHDLPQAMQYADRIALLGGGRLLGCDTSAALAATGAVDRVFGVRLCRAPDGVWYVKAEG